MLIQLSGSEPLYKQIYRELRVRILRGELVAGTRVPSSRILAEELRVSRNVVLLAYEQLIAEGYLVSRHGGGTFVASIPDEYLTSAAVVKIPAAHVLTKARLSEYATRLCNAPKGPLCRPTAPQGRVRYDFIHGQPAIDLLEQRTWRRLIAHRAACFSRYQLAYGPTEGDPSLREAVAEYARAHRGVQCDASQVVIVNGSQQALDLTIRILLDPGDSVVVEEPCYPGTRQALAGIGAKIRSIRVDDHGLVVESLSNIVEPVRLICVTPSHQYPTGSVMSLERRLTLVAFARKVGSYILEDDYDSEFRYDQRPEKSLQGLDPYGRVVYVGTFSKVLFPSLRLGYVILPKQLVEPFVLAKSIADRHSPTFAQGVLAEFIREGHFYRHLRRVRRGVGERRTVLIQALDQAFGDNVKVVGASAGMHLLAWFPRLNRSDLKDRLARALELGVAAYPVDPCYTLPPPCAGLVLGFAAMTTKEIGQGIIRLAEALMSAAASGTMHPTKNGSFGSPVRLHTGSRETVQPSSA